MSPFEDLVARAEADPAVLGLILSGSMAREGMATSHSDHDVFVIVAERGGQWSRTRKTPELDEIIATLAELEDTSNIWARYAMRGAKILMDRVDGRIAELVAAQATPTEAEADAWAREGIGGYVNQIYRAAKSRRDGRPDLARLDELESVSWFLTALFALHGRIRPYNKYLRWELETYPLGDPWTAERLVDQLTNAPGALFEDLEKLVRAKGLGAELDDWGVELSILRSKT